MPHQVSDILAIQLNHCIRRIDCKASLLELVEEQSCSLKRIRRSSHWLLQGEIAHLRALSTKLKQTSMLWIAKAIDNALPKPVFDLAELLATDPAMTANQLMAITGCSLVEARTAIDHAEGFA